MKSQYNNLAIRCKALLRRLAFLAVCLLAFPANGQYGGYTMSMTYPSGPLSSMYAGGYIRVQVPIERVGHNFSLKWKTSSTAPETTSSAYAPGFITALGTQFPIGSGVVLQSLLVVGFPPSPTYVYTPVTYTSGGVTYTTYTYTMVPFSACEWWLCDTTAGQESVHRFATPGANEDLRNTTWTQATGSPTRYFAIPDSRLGHGLVAGKPAPAGAPPTAGFWTPVTQGYYTIGTYSNGTSGSTVPLHWFTGSAPVSEDGILIADRTTDERATANATDVRATTAWAQDPAYRIYPFATANVTLQPYEAGHRYMVHCKIGTAPEMQIPATAVLAPAGTSSALTFLVPSGVPFWVTRDAENFVSPRPVAPSATTTWTATVNNQTFSAVSPVNVFPLSPNRTLVPHKFRINAQSRAGHTFTVRMGDGYSTHFTSFGSEQIDNWDDHGVPHPLPLYTLTAMIDPNFNAWLYDESTGASVKTVDGTVTQEDVLDGWVPMHGTAPTYPTIALQLPASRIGHEFALSYIGPDSPGGFYAPSSPVLSEHHDIGVEGMAGYDLRYISFALDSPAPYVGTFTLTDDAAPGESAQIIHGGDSNNLRTWFLPPVNRALQISSSRWGHTLRIRHPDGEAHPIQQHELAGDTSGASHPLQYESYYYFDADGDARSELPWYVEDVHTGERIGPVGTDTYPTNDALIGWISTPTPAAPTAADDGTGGVTLQWDLGLVSRDGSFTVERNTRPGWEIAGTIPADSATPSMNQLTFNDQPGSFPPEIQYRVSYHYGGQASANSGVTTFHWLDSDGDGLPDAWELAWGFDPNTANAATAWLIGDGRTLLELFTQNVAPPPPGSGAPETEDRRRLYLRAGTDENGTGCLVWDAPAGATGNVTIEMEKYDGHWEQVETTAVSVGKFYPPPGMWVWGEDEVRRALNGAGPAFNDPWNFRLRGAYTSNESAVKVRLMMRTSKVERSQSGFREFTVAGSPEPSPAEKRYYNSAAVALTQYKTNSGSNGAVSWSSWDWFERDTTISHDTTVMTLEWQTNTFAAGGVDGTDGAGPFGSSFSWSNTDWGHEASPFEVDASLTFGNSYDDSTSWWSSGPLGGTSYALANSGGLGEQTTRFETALNVGPPRSEIRGPGETVGSYSWWRTAEWTTADGIATESDSGSRGPGGVTLPGLPADSIVADSPTHARLDEEDDHVAYHLDVQLSEAYPTNLFLSDTRAKFPPLLGEQGIQVSSSAGFSTFACFDEFPRREEGMRYPPGSWGFQTRETATSERSLAADAGGVTLMRSEYWLECNDCGPQAAVGLMEMEEDFPPGSAVAIGQPKLVRLLTITPGATPGKKQEIAHRPSDVTGSTFRDVTGNIFNTKRYLHATSAGLLVDANRDGAMSFANADSDQTTQQRPYRFWINDDDDVSGSVGSNNGVETVPPVIRDSDLHGIGTKRNLEDFARLWISLGDLRDAVMAGTVHVGLKWKRNAGEGTPAINIYKSADPDGSTDYLSIDSAALAQISGEPNHAIKDTGNKETVDMSGTFMIPQSFWTGIAADVPKKCLVFEGVAEGKRQLVPVFFKGTVQIGEGGGVWIDLKNIKKMYERAKVASTPDPIAPPSDTTYPENNPPEPTMSWEPDPNGTPPDHSPASWQESEQYIVLVHGWNMTYQDSQNYAETMFKRLWQRGYKGRFARFYWPTLVGLFTYNDSEYRAWKSGESLKQFMASLHPGYTRNLVSHSMGGIVCGSALQKGMSVTNYALCHSAIPAACYWDSPTLDEGWGYSTPHYDSDSGTRNLSYRYKLNSVSGNLINFFLPPDKALKAWELNNYTSGPGSLGAKPQRYTMGTTGYSYNPWDSIGNRLWLSAPTTVGPFPIIMARYVNTPHEGMAYVAQSPTKTVGAKGETRGAIDRWVDLETADYGFEDVHSAEYQFTPQRTKKFFNKLLQEFNLLFIP